MFGILGSKHGEHGRQSCELKKRERCSASLRKPPEKQFSSLHKAQQRAVFSLGFPSHIHATDFRASRTCVKVSVFQVGEEASVPSLRLGWGGSPLPFDPVSLTNQERNATQVKVRQAWTFAPCVNRLLVR